MKKLITLLILAIGSFAATAQTIDYKIRYNSSSCKYEAYAFANAAQASVNAMTSLFTIVVPSGVSNGAVSNVTHVAPGSSGWNLLSSPAYTSSYDYYPVALTPSSSYPAMASGDSILLFTFALNNDACASNVRPWTLGTDPVAISGNSYQNSFQTLSFPILDKYSGNKTSATTLTNPAISAMVPNCVSTTHGINLTASGQGAAASCGSLSYNWSGPNSFTSSAQNITVADHVNSIGSYTVTVKDNFGCSTSGSLTLDSSNCFAAPVPVSMLYFTGARVNGVNKLSWSTASEINNSHFILERRINEGAFEYFDKIESNAPGGNSHSILNYHYDDKTMHAKGAIIYYKLRQVDFDGKNETFGPVIINIDAPTTISVFPNPATDKINVVGLSSEYAHTIEVLDVLGKTVLTLSTDKLDAELDISNFSVGIYTVRVSNNRGVLNSYKILIQE